MNVEIADRLAKRRREAGYSQEELADKLGVSRQAVSKWERSESSPDTNNLIALAKLYEVSLDDLLYVDSSIEDDIAFETQDRAPKKDETSEESVEDDDEDEDEDEDDEDEDGFVSIGWDGIHVKDGPKGDEVYVGWKGVHVREGGSGGDEVHVGWKGVHVREAGSDGDEVDWVPGEGVIINGEHYDSWQEVTEAFTGSKSIWLKFPYPMLIVIIYLWMGFASALWWPGALLFLTIPLYYTVIDAFVKKSVAPSLTALYALGVTFGYFYIGYTQQVWHPNWLIFLTIPLVSWLITSLFGRKKKR